MIEQQTVLATAANQLPPPALKDALISNYFEYIYHRMPVVDRRDIASPNASVLLLQALCFVGSVLRHPRSDQSIIESEKLYVKAKTLWFTNHEPNPLIALKAACLLSSWTVTSPAIVTIDCNWNWMGLAVRIALQLGLHRESTYSKRPFPGYARKIAWFLFAQDKLVSACFGRPQMLRRQEFDLRLPEESDFEEQDRPKAYMFRIFSDLTTILARILPGQHHDPSNRLEEALPLLTELKTWIRNVPSYLHPFNDKGHKVYNREFYEVLAWYLTCVITYFHVFGRFFLKSQVSRISLVASSCLIRISQEMDFRDDVNYLLAINNWAFMVAGLPQINNLRRRHVMSEEDAGPDSLTLEELDTLMGILKQRTLKFPGVKTIIGRIESMREEALSSETSLDAEDTTGQASNSAPMTVPEPHELFPFNPALSPRMHLLFDVLPPDIEDGIFDTHGEWTIDNLFNLDEFNQQLWNTFEL